MIFDIIYYILLFFGSYFVIFHLNLWFENRENICECYKKVNDSALPPLSLIIPAYNEEGNIRKTLEKITKIDYPRKKLEIIVVDDGSTDRTYRVAKEFKSNLVKVYTKPNKGKANALNYGISKSKGDFIAVMDADTYIDREALKKCMKYFDDKEVAAVTSFIICSKKHNFWEKMQEIEMTMVAATRKMEEYANVIQCTPGPLSVYRKNILEKLGWFDEDILVEDIEIAWKILNSGYKIKMATDAIVYSTFPNNFRRWWNQRVRWSIGGIQVLKKYLHSIKDRNSPVGTFLIPIYLLGFGSSILGIGMFLYLLLLRITTSLLYNIRAYKLGLNLLSDMEMVYYIDIKVIIGFLVFAMTMYLLKISLKFMRSKLDMRGILQFIFIYPVLFPFVNLMGIYKYYKGERGWLTK